MLTLRCLGDLRLERDGLPQLRARRKPLALLVFLLRRRERPSSREELADLLWGASGDANARRSLRQCLSELRPVVGDGLVESTQGLLLAPDAMDADVRRFDDAFAAGEWAIALGCWSGEFLPDGESLGSETWRTWLEAERVALRHRLAIAGDHVTLDAESRGAWQEVVVAATRWRALLPSDARAWVREIHALQSSGRLAEAHARMGEAEQCFVNVLGVPLPPELARIGRALSRLQGTSGTPLARLLTPELVGRDDVLAHMERARLLSRSSTAARGASMTLIAPEGMGKSRVLREFARQARERGDLVIDTRASDLGYDRALALCRTIVTLIAGQPALAGCPPETLAALAHVAPELRESFRHLPTVPAPDHEMFSRAFARALGELASASPCVLALDDLPCADGESIAVLVALLQRVPSGLLVVATGRADAWRDTPALVELLQHVDPSAQLSLDAMSPGDVRAMLSSMASMTAPDLDVLAPTLHRLSGGNPADLTSLLRDAVSGGALEPGESGQWRCAATPVDPACIPPDLEARWRRRYARLPEHAQGAVDALAVLAHLAPDAAMSAWEQVSALAPANFRAAVDRLSISGIVQVPRGTARFTSEAHQALAYEAIAPSARAQLSVRAEQARGTRESTAPARATIVRDPSAMGVAPPRRRTIGISLVAAAVVLSVLGWRVFSPDAEVRVTAPVVLLDVENLTGDPAFGRPVFLAASVALQQSRRVTLFPRARVRETLQLMRRPGADSLLDEALGREIAIRENLPRLVALGVGRLDSVYVLTARVIDPASGRDLFVATERASAPSDVLTALDGLVRHVRRALGEPADSLRRYGEPLPRLTTASLPALQAWATGADLSRRRQLADAQAAYQRAVELDSSFALAWLSLAELHFQSYSNRPAGDSALARALALSSRLSERERLRVQLTVAIAQGRRDDEVRVSRQLAERFPERDTWYNHGAALMRARRCGEAIPALERALAFDARFVNAHINIATCHQFVGAYDAAVRAYTQAHAIDSTAVYGGALNHEYGVALVRAGLVDSAFRVHTRMAGQPDESSRQFGQRSLGFLSAYAGRYGEAVAHFARAAASARAAQVTLSEFRNHVLQAQHLATRGDARGTQVALDSAWAAGARQSLTPHFAMVVGIEYVRAGQLGRATAMLDAMARTARPDAPEDRSAQAILAAHVALARGRARDARAVLLTATDTTRADFSLAILTEVYSALGHADSAHAAASRLAARAPYGTDAQDAWLRAGLTEARLAESLGLGEQAALAYGRLRTQLDQGDADFSIRREAAQGIARLTRADAAAPRPVVRRP